MSEAAAAIAADLATSDRKAYFEQRIFVFSPLGTLATAFLIFALFAGAYWLCAALDGAAIFAPGPASLWLSARSQVAFSLSLIVATILGVQRHARIRERRDLQALAAILEGGAASASFFAKLTPQGARLWQATAAGVLIGLVAGWFLRFRGGDMGPAAQAWFAFVTVVLFVLFTRGFELTRISGQNVRAVFERELMIDLLRIEKLSVIGRAAARVALIWFVSTAAFCLLFLNMGLTLFTVGFVVACAAMGVWIFVFTMEQVHRRICAAKAEELEHIRRDIEAARLGATAGAGAAARLQGLVAYEERIARVPEWPSDQTTLMRVGASALILALPWFGQAVAASLIEHLGH